MCKRPQFLFLYLFLLNGKIRIKPINVKLQKYGLQKRIIRKIGNIGQNTYHRSQFRYDNIFYISLIVRKSTKGSYSAQTLRFSTQFSAHMIGNLEKDGTRLILNSLVM